MIVPFMDSQFQDLSTTAWVSAGVFVVLSVVLLLCRKRVYDADSYPSYHEIPDSVLTHTPSKKELVELGQNVDVIVRVSSTISRFLYEILKANLLVRLEFVIVCIQT